MVNKACIARWDVRSANCSVLFFLSAALFFFAAMNWSSGLTLV